MARHFNEQDIAEFRDCFNLFARSGQIRTLDELAVIMRSLHTSPTINELKNYMKMKNGKMLFADFLEIMHLHTQKEKTAKEIRAAFAAADPLRRGAIPVKELRHFLQGWGERLSSKEVDQIFREANIKSNTMVKYEDFVKVVVAPVPDYYF
nr:EOG090X0GKM [Cyclestheria hislopi]